MIRAVRLSSQFRKYSAHRRFLSQRQYSTDLKIVLRETEPDVVLSSNTPIDIQAELLWDCRKRRVGFVHWIQDLYSRALRFFVQRRFPALAVPVEAIFGFLERAVIAGSDHSVVIAPEFREVLCQWNIPPANVTVIENWAALEEMPQKPRDNEWSRAQKLGSRPVLLYSGTLGMKHRPDLIYLLARELQQECSMIVVTDGIGREYLERMPPLANLQDRLQRSQPYERLPEVAAYSADVSRGDARGQSRSNSGPLQKFLRTCVQAVQFSLSDLGKICPLRSWNAAVPAWLQIPMIPRRALKRRGNSSLTRECGTASEAAPVLMRSEHLISAGSQIRSRNF